MVGQQKRTDGTVKQKYVTAISLLKDVVFEETHDNSMNTEIESPSAGNGGGNTGNGGSNTSGNTGGGGNSSHEPIGD